MTGVLAGIACFIVGGLFIRYRELWAEMRRDGARWEARYGSLLNAERANRERDAELTSEARRTQPLAYVFIGLWIIAMGVVATVYGIKTW